MAAARPPATRRVAAALAAALVLAAGCGGEDGALGAQRRPSEADVAAVTAAELAAVFPPRPTGAAAVEALRAFAATVAGCMRREGHDYDVAVEPRVVVAGEPDPGPPLTVDQLDGVDPSSWLPFARTYGYGYTHDRRLQVVAAALPPFADPNLEREQRLGPDERRAWFVDLYGERFPDGQPTAADQVFPPDDPSAGCHGEAVAAHRPLTRLPPAARAALSAVDAPVTEAEGAWAAWAACMRVAGFTVASRTEALALAAGTPAGAAAAPSGGGPGGGGGPGERREVRRGATTAVVAVPPLDEAALAEEVRLATADAACDREAGVWRLVAEVRSRRQAEFVAAWRPELVRAGILPGDSAPGGGAGEGG